MAQLNQIVWSTIFWGGCGVFFMLCFGIAIQLEWNSSLTPKAWNRPRNVLKNVLKRHQLCGCWNLYPITWFLWSRSLGYANTNTNTSNNNNNSNFSDEEEECDPTNDATNKTSSSKRRRSNTSPSSSTTFAWGNMLQGIEGTGTRDDGWTGPTLKMNLDGIILLKYHYLLFKISLFTTIICCGILLPTYTTSLSICDDVTDTRNSNYINNNNNNTNSITNDNMIIPVRECQRLASLTDFENLTILSIPEIYQQYDDWDDNNNDVDARVNADTDQDSDENENSNNDGEVDDRTYTNNSTSSLRRTINSKLWKNRNPTTQIPKDSYINPISDIPVQPQTATGQQQVLTTSELLDENGNIIIPPAPIQITGNLYNRENYYSLKWIPGISWRLWTVTICSAVIYAYTCYLLWYEWIDNLALRRQYFLNADHYKIRMEELHAIANLQTKPEDPIITGIHRPPFVPHPEMKEIPPSIGLYSVLYQLPQSLVTFDTDGETQMERQLCATVNFFNECVPVVPSSSSSNSSSGYTSSVVAATIIPDASRVSKVWIQWYRLTHKIRMVRYIRKIIRQKQYKLHTGKKDIYDDVATVLHQSNHKVKTVTASVLDSVATGVHDAKNRSVTFTTQRLSSSLAAVRRVRMTGGGRATADGILQEDSSSFSDSITSSAAATTSAATDGTDGNGVEMTTIIGDDDEEEKTALLLSSGTQPLSPIGGNNDHRKTMNGTITNLTTESGAMINTTTTATTSTDSYNDDDDEIIRQDIIDNSDGGSSGGFWQNVFSRRWENDDNRKTKNDEDDGNDVGNDAPALAGPDHSLTTDEVDISEEFMEGSFIESSSTVTAKDIESQQLPLSNDKDDHQAGGFARSTDTTTTEQSSTVKFYGAKTTGFKYEDYDVREYAKTISHNEETELIDVVDGLGIEELSVFAREYAQSSSSPCPFGVAPNLLKISSIDELRDKEEDLLDEIKELNIKLIEARQEVVRAYDGDDINYEVVNSSMMVSTPSLDDNGERNNSNTTSSVIDVDVSASSMMSISDNFDSSRFSYFDDSSISSPNSKRSVFGCSLRNRGTTTSGTSPTATTADNSSMKEIPETASLMIKPGGFDNGSGGLTSRYSRLFTCCSSSKYLSKSMLPKYYGHIQGAGKAFVTALDHPSYAVITFTSRQNAIKARQCLVGGVVGGDCLGMNNNNVCCGSNDSWQQIDEIPIPPLADAPPCNLCFCRGCCRPVTLTINYKAKLFRKFSVCIFLVLFSCFYTIPLAFISIFLNPRRLGQYFPDWEALHNEKYLLYKVLAGPASGLFTTLFMALLPQIFKLIAYYEGTSSSLEMAERKALMFMWYFMLVTVFFGQYLATMLIQWYYHAGVTNVSMSLWSTVNLVAGLIPSSIAPERLNWIIMRYGFTWPAGYFFQINTFLTKFLRLKCCNRVARGGGPGGPTPFRIYVDSGVIFLCVVGLAPMVPIVAPIATIYFIVVQPMLRWLLIFVYRPRYDTGGDKWPLCHQIIISSLIMAQILTATTLALKGSLGGSVFIGGCTFPTLWFSMWTEERFLRAYRDTALSVQESHRSSSSSFVADIGQESYTYKEREEFRRWLVDCHKASYVPTCMLGSKENLLTVEPAVVIPKDTDGTVGVGGVLSSSLSSSSSSSSCSTSSSCCSATAAVESSSSSGGQYRIKTKQKGGIYNRKQQ